MVYKWKLNGIYSVPAQEAGEELERIQRKRGLEAAHIVDESRPETAVLHPCFEWNDWKAAEKYREQQARNIVQCIVTTQVNSAGDPVKVRAFPHVAGEYRPLQVAVSSYHNELVDEALQCMETFERRFSVYSSLQPVIEEMKRARPKLMDEAGRTTSGTLN